MVKRNHPGEHDGPMAIADIGLMREFEKRARQQLKPPTAAQRRLIEAASAADAEVALALLYQHSALCQTGGRGGCGRPGQRGALTIPER